MSDSEKNKIIDLAIAQIEKQHGKGAIMRFNSDEIVPVAAIPTGSIGLDIALGVGGLPRGRVIEIYGHEGSGKTTLTLHVVAEAQKLGGVAAFIDVEHAIDPLYAKNIGVDMDSVLISQPDTAEQALEIAETLIHSGAIDVVVIDSVAVLAPLPKHFFLFSYAHRPVSASRRVTLVALASSGCHSHLPCYPPIHL